MSCIVSTLLVLMYSVEKNVLLLPDTKETCEYNEDELHYVLWQKEYYAHNFIVTFAKYVYVH